MADGLRALLAQQGDVEIVGDVTRHGVLAAAREHDPDVVVILAPALTMEHDGELAALSALSKVVLIARGENVRRAMEAVRLGVRAVVAPDSSALALLQTLRTVVTGDAFVLPAEAHAGLDTPAPRTGSEATTRLAAGLTMREKEILLFLARGSSNAEIAAKLSVSTATVRSHVHHLLGKLDLGTRTQAVAVAYESGLLALVEFELGGRR
jgi:DNA-binding NarL/FixJ family response regulator